MSDDPAAPSLPVPVPVAIERLAVGGDGVGRLPDGRVAFVSGGVPGDVVRATIADERPRFVRGFADEVVTPSAARSEPHCPMIAKGCGGCAVAPVDSTALLDWKIELAADTVNRLGRVQCPPIRRGATLPTEAFRTAVRFATDAAGRPGFRRRRGHELVTFESCPVLHPTLDTLIGQVGWPPRADIAARLGVASNSATVVAHGDDVDASRLASALRVVADAVGIGVSLAGASADCHVEEAVGGRRWRVSAGSFFQTRPDGADALVAEVRAAVSRLRGGGIDAVAGTVVDACAGVGLLGGSIESRHLVAVEVSRSSCADARHNLDGRSAEVVCADLSRWYGGPADVVIADPARAGLARGGVRAILRPGPAAVILVSCDIASMARDVGMLSSAGYVLDDVVALDLFPHTAHLELVSTLVVAAPGADDGGGVRRGRRGGSARRSRRR